MAKYTVQPGETPRDVAKRYTGDERRYRDLLPINPHMKTVVGQLGAPDFDTRDWHDGLVVNIPTRWSESGQIHGVRPSGSVGCGGRCGPSNMNPQGPPKWLVPQFAPPSGMVENWGKAPGLANLRRQRRTSELGYFRGMMYGVPGQLGEGVGDEYDVGKNVPGGTGGGTGGTCNLQPMNEVKPYEFLLNVGDTLWGIAQGWLGKDDVSGPDLYTARMLQRANVGRLQSDCSNLKGSLQIQIPKDWPPCPAKWADRRVNPDGTPWTDVEPPAPTKVPGGKDGIDRIGVSEGDSGTIMWILAGAVGVVAAVYAAKYMKKKR